MFLFLSKLLPLFVYPIGLASILLVLSLFLRRHAKLNALCVILALLLLVGFGNQWIAATLVRSLEYQYIPEGEVPEADAIVLLGGSTRPVQWPRQLVEVSESGDRMIYAAHLYHTGKADHIVSAGGYIEFYGSRTPEAVTMAEILSMLGVPEEAIWLEDRSRNTYENAVYSKEILEEHGINRVLLVTSAIHMPRSVRIFEKQGIDVIPAPTDFQITTSEPMDETQAARSVLNLIPSVEHLERSTRALKEYIGMVVYRLRGWL